MEIQICKNCKYPRKGHQPQCGGRPNNKFLLEFESESGMVINVNVDKPLCLTSKEEALELLEKAQRRMDKAPEKTN